MTLMGFFLLGCHKEINYISLMQHPNELKTVLRECQLATYSYCDDANRAAKDFTLLINERAEDPELFGQKIMHAQQELALLSQNYLQAQQGKNKDKTKAVEQAYRAQKNKLKILYAVVLETSQSILGGEGS